MRTTLKLVLPLVLSVASISLLYAAYQVRTERRNLDRDLSRRASILAETLAENVEPHLDRGSDKSLQRLIQRYVQREHLKGVAVYDSSGNVLAITSGIALTFTQRPAVVMKVEKEDSASGDYITVADTPTFVYALPLEQRGEAPDTLAVVYDTSYLEARVSRTLRDSLLSALLQTLLITGLALVLVRWVLTEPLRRTAQWLGTLRTNPTPQPEAPPKGEIFERIQSEVVHLVNDLSTARATAEEEARLRETQSHLWTAQRLRVSLRDKLLGKPPFVVSNREPYMHVLDEKDKTIRMIVPASGVVTALEPVLLACNGTWIANGSGNADRMVVDANDRLRVPPDRPSYTLRRVWMTDEEDRGYYEGFSNEGLWPLCHIAHTRPIFRPQDWIHYQQINRRFADAVLQEMEGTESPIVLAQDYHLALLPRMVKEARPDARVAIFWHIPWPNPEAFGICPWQRELVDGLLGADLIGFHIQTHCNNFMETVDHALEALTEWDRFAVNRQGHVTRVRPFPISVAFPENGNGADDLPSAGAERAAICEELGIEASLLGVGVDRVDYTKGLLERFRAIERFLELNPAYQRRFTFVQIGAPSRTDIERYRSFLDEVSAEAERINSKLQAGNWKPIVFLKRHHSHDEISRYYRAASLCLVTSLHDGMNLVAKEFVAARTDGRGVLILSTFAGAAHELTDALLVNPYDIAQLGELIRQGLEMPENEEARRMQRMRRIVKEHNVYRWAANLLSDLTEIQIEEPARVETAQLQ